MSIIALDPNVRKKVEAELEVKIPTPDEESFEGFLESLKTTHPELHRELVLGLSVTKMPAEKEAAKAARRTRFRKLIDRLFFLTKWPGSRVLDKKRVVYAGLGALALLLPTAYLLSSNYLRAERDRQSETSVDTADSGSALGGVGYVDNGLEVEDPTQGVATWLFTDTQVTPRPAETPPSTSDTSDRTFTPFPSDLPPPATSATLSNAAGPPSLPTGQTNQLSNSTQPPSQLSITSSSQEPQKITIWQRTSASGEGMGAPASLEVANLSNQQPQAIATFEREEQVIPMTRESQSEGGSGADAASQTGQPASLTVFAREVSGSQALSVVALKGEDEAAPFSSDSPTAQTQTNPAPPAPEPDATPAASAVESAKGEPQPAQISVDTALQPGARLPVTLATGITVTEKTSTPVVAETKGDWCGESPCPDITWIGTARLSTSDRVEIEFTEAVIGTEPKTVTAVALGNDEGVGLSVSLQSAAADVAQDLLQGAAGGVSDYLEALVNQKQITFQDGAVVQEGQVPGIETFILGRFAELISPPTTSAQQVKVASIPAETAFTILYGVSRTD